MRADWCMSVYKTLESIVHGETGRRGGWGRPRTTRMKNTYTHTRDNGPFWRPDGRVVSDRTRLGLDRDAMIDDDDDVCRERTRHYEKKRCRGARVLPVETRLFSASFWIGRFHLCAGTCPKARGTLVNYACLALITPRGRALCFSV